jgi:hypothetical protein
MQPRLGVRAIPGCGLDRVGERPVPAQCKAVLSPSAPSAWLREYPFTSENTVPARRIMGAERTGLTSPGQPYRPRRRAQYARYMPQFKAYMPPDDIGFPLEYEKLDKSSAQP